MDITGMTRRSHLCCFQCDIVTFNIYIFQIMEIYLVSSQSATTRRTAFYTHTCSEKRQRMQSVMITRASSTVAPLRKSPRDSTRGMLPTCQSQHSTTGTSSNQALKDNRYEYVNILGRKSREVRKGRIDKEIKVGNKRKLYVNVKVFKN